MQYFCGFEVFSIQKPFDSSLMVHFRKRLTEEVMREISETAFIEETKKAIESEEAKNKAEEDKDNDDNNDGNSKPKGTLLLDAICFPADIHFPTDVGLLNHARELTEQIIDNLWNSSVRISGMAWGAAVARGDIKEDGGSARSGLKPRTYREVARKAYMEYVKKRKKQP